MRLSRRTRRSREYARVRSSHTRHAPSRLPGRCQVSGSRSPLGPWSGGGRGHLCSIQRWSQEAECVLCTLETRDQTSPMVAHSNVTVSQNRTHLLTRHSGDFRPFRDAKTSETMLECDDSSERRTATIPRHRAALSPHTRRRSGASAFSLILRHPLSCLLGDDAASRHRHDQASWAPPARAAADAYLMPGLDRCTAKGGQCFDRRATQRGQGA